MEWDGLFGRQLIALELEWVYTRYRGCTCYENIRVSWAMSHVDLSTSPTWFKPVFHCQFL